MDAPINTSVAPLARDIVAATFAALDRLAPDARIAFLLHDIFAADDAELALALGRSEGDCRALVEAARQQLRHEHITRLPRPSRGAIPSHPPVQENTMTQRINYMQQSPELFKKFLEFSNLTASCAIDEKTRHLVEIRASQINGCAFCLDMHVKQATIHAERALRIHHLPTWRESTLFSPKERAALAWTEILTKLPEHGVADEAYDRVRTQLSEKELSDLTFVVMSINAWNRVNVGFASVPGSADKAFGLDKAELN